MRLDNSNPLGNSNTREARDAQHDGKVGQMARLFKSGHRTGRQVKRRISVTRWS